MASAIFYLFYMGASPDKLIYIIYKGGIPVYVSNYARSI